MNETVVIWPCCVLREIIDTQVIEDGYQEGLSVMALKIQVTLLFVCVVL